MEQPPQPQSPTPLVGQPPVPTLTPPEHYTDGWGIASIILASLSLNLPGFIVGLIGASKAKRIGAAPVLSRIGWIVNLAMMILGLIIGSLFFWYVMTHPNGFKSTHQNQTSPTERYY